MESKTISRQRKWQLQRAEKGLCMKCASPLYRMRMCPYHYLKQLGYSKMWKRRRKEQKEKA